MKNSLCFKSKKRRKSDVLELERVGSISERSNFENQPEFDYFFGDISEATDPISLKLGLDLQ